MKDKIKIYNEDCLQAMRLMSDKQFDLAIVDPPYGIDVKTRVFDDGKHWDSNTPTKEYFDELFRVSNNQIIWGGNYFDLPPTQGFYIWDKKQPHDFSLAMCEMAWSSLQKPAKMWSLSVLKERNKIHPTQKPVQLYEWLLMNNAEQGFEILDTHLGGGSIAIACHNLGYNLTACEIDYQYFTDATERLRIAQSQLTMF